MESQHTNKSVLEARREALRNAEDANGVKMLEKMLLEYGNQMQKILADDELSQKPLNIWLPYCDRPLPAFERRITEDGYVCQFTEQNSGSHYRDTFCRRHGYLVAETDADLKKNWIDPNK